MKEFLSNGIVGNLEYNAQKQIRKSIQNRWDELGFTEGFPEGINLNQAIAPLRQCAKENKDITQEGKELLLKDLYARLPYGVCVHIRYKEGEPCYGKLTPRDIQWFIDSKIKEIKPYLRPISSMTKEELYEVQEILGRDVEIHDGFISIIDSSRNSFSYLELQAVFDWFNAHHFDFRNLIGRGLAIDCTNLNIY